MSILNSICKVPLQQYLDLYLIEKPQDRNLGGVIFRVLHTTCRNYIKDFIFIFTVPYIINSLLQQRNDKINQRDKTVYLNTDLLSVAHTRLEIFISMLRGQIVDFHIPVFRLCTLGFLHRRRPLYIIYFSIDFPRVLLVLSYQ